MPHLKRYPLAVTFLIAFALWAVIILGAVFLVGCKTVYDKPVVADSATFVEAINEYDVTVIVFRADWCPACRRLDPILDQAAKTYAGQIKIVKVNTDKTDETAFGYNAEYIPYVVVRNKGVDVFLGNLDDRDHLNRLIAKELGIK